MRASFQWLIHWVETGALAAFTLMVPPALAGPPAASTPPATSTPLAASTPPAAPTPPASPQEDRCPKGRIVKVKPAEQKQKFRKATSTTEMKGLLEPLGLLTDWAQDLAACAKEDPPNVTLDVFRARILSASTVDFVLQARGRVCGREILVGTLLHPLEQADTFCALGLPFLPGERPNLLDDTTFGFANLTDPVRQVFKVKGSRNDLHESEQWQEYWEAQQGELRVIFSISSQDWGGIYHGSSSAEVTMSGSGYPRELKLEESSQSCGNFMEMPSGESVYSSDCTSAGSTKRLCYQPAADPKSKGFFEYSRCPGSTDDTY